MYSNLYSRPLQLGIALALCGLVAGCGSEAKVPEMPRPVRSVVVTDDATAQATTYTAEIRSRYASDLSFQVSGKLIRRVVDVGATVRKGDVLAQLDPVDQRLGVDASRAAVLAARAELDRVRVEESRYRDLLERGLTTHASYLAQQTAVKTSQSKLEQATADLRLSEQRLGYTTLRADVDGVVTSVMGEVGTVVSAGQRIVSIAQPNELEAAFDVPDAHIEAVRTASDIYAKLLTSDSTTYLVRVREISPTADAVTRTYQVKATLLDAPSALRLGMTVSVVVPQSGSQTAISLPASALFQKAHQPAVWIVKQDHTLELRPVQVQRYESERVLVATGLARGERVVTAGVHRLLVGEHVRLLEGVTP